MRRRAVVFTIAFFLLFFSLLSLALLYSESVRDSDRGVSSARRVLKEGALAGNVAENLAAFLNLSVSGSRTAANTTIRIAGRLPWRDQDFSAYESFFNSGFSPTTNLNGTLDLSAFQANPFLNSTAAGINISLSSARLNFSFPSAAAHSVRSRFEGAAELNDTEWVWQSCASSCPVGEVHLSLDIANSTGSSLQPGGCSGGCVLESEENFLSVNSSSPDVFNLTVAAGSAVFMAAPGAGLELQINSTLNQTNETALAFPVNLSFPGRPGAGEAVLVRI